MIEFGINICHILKNTHPEIELTHQTLTLLNDLVKLFIEKIISVTNQMILRDGYDCVTIKNVRKAVDKIMVGELKNRAIIKAQRAVISYVIAKRENKQIYPIEKQKSAGVYFSVNKIETVMMKNAMVNKKEDEAGVYIAGLCEYVITEILDLTGGAIKNSKKGKIPSRYIVYLIRNDSELSVIYDQFLIED